MAQDQTKKEALFNEVKGSLFEYLVARQIASLNQCELIFQQSLDRNYLTVLSQQDRMVRQFYPEMLGFLDAVSKKTVEAILPHLQGEKTSPQLMGKFSNSTLAQELHEADLLLKTGLTTIPVSLKLNKKNAYVNTKSGGIKSFFTQYFPFIEGQVQDKFNRLVDMEFDRMARELHAFHDLDYSGNFNEWIKKGFSELPGELSTEERNILKKYYARIAHEIHLILSQFQKENGPEFSKSLAPLMGFGSSDILQVVCFHDFKNSHECDVQLHSFNEIAPLLKGAQILPFQDIASVEIIVGYWSLQIRVKPMNKFTTTAIKMNCSVKVMRPSGV